MKKMIIGCLLGMNIFSPIYAEIQSITVRWTAQLCQGNCTALLERELRKISDVDTILIDQVSGQATLTWKEGAPFQYASVNIAMRMVGLSIRNMRIKVRGLIQNSGDAFFIQSGGDYTRFELLNPVTPYRGGVSNEFNASARKILPGLRQQLLEGMSQRLIATVEGPVFMPERNTVPTQIVLDSLSFEVPKEEAKSMLGVRPSRPGSQE